MHIINYSRVFSDEGEIINYITRYLEPYIKTNLTKKMVFVSSPRQYGKTTMALKILKDLFPDFTKGRYMNWDAVGNRENIIRERFPARDGFCHEIHNSHVN